ncbi:MAG TPA: UbiD family decarboxylase [Symbiobacteriaceae bacterium]|nr:UbiD family decarboxylase [Symbiobacteriaceae bacterium]
MPRSLRQFLDVLRKQELLRVIDKPVNRDWEISAVCRTYFSKTDPRTRPALLFTNVIGSSLPVLVGAVAGSHQIYGLALGIDPSAILAEFSKKWARALENPLSPKMVAEGPCQENVVYGDQCDVTKLPNPIWTRAHDPGPFFTAGSLISRSPESGIINVGMYRSQVKGPRRLGVHFTAAYKHLNQHIQAAARAGHKLPVVLAVGVDPTLSITSVSAVPYDVDEMAVAGALLGEPMEVVKAKTCDLPVPASAEIVIEGEIDPTTLFEEGPFGEYPGYMGPKGVFPEITVNCITHRTNPILQCVLSQMPPSESSLMRSVQRESKVYAFLKDTLKLRVRDVFVTESGGGGALVYISMDKRFAGEVAQAATGVWSIEPTLGKFTIVTDSDIDIRNPFNMEWAVAFRTRPDKDISVYKDMAPLGLDPSLFPPGLVKGTEEITGSKVLIDATMKFTYPDQSLPPKEDLQKVQASWGEYRLG